MIIFSKPVPNLISIPLQVSRPAEGSSAAAGCGAVDNLVRLSAAKNSPIYIHTYIHTIIHVLLINYLTILFSPQNLKDLLILIIYELTVSVCEICEAN